MKVTGVFTIVIGVLGAGSAWCQIQSPAGQRSGPGVQAAQDAKEPDVLKTCKVPPPARGGRGGAGRGPAPAPGPRTYMVTEIPGVVAGGSSGKTSGKWTAITPTALSPPRMAVFSSHRTTRAMW